MVIGWKVSRILVPLDGSKNASRGLEKAIGIARQCGAIITAIVSLETPPHSEFRGSGSLAKGASDEAKKILGDARTLAAKSGIVLKEKLMHGNVGYNIVKTAHSKSIRYDIIVMGSRGRSNVREVFFGSVSNYVVHTSKIPVLIVK